MKFWKEKESEKLKGVSFWQGEFITELSPNEVFVFGSNPEARHFAGAAKSALKFGAIPRSGKTQGISRGFSPNKQTYGIITKNLTAGITVDGITYDKEGYLSVSSEQIRNHIAELYLCAKENPDKKFLITYKYETWPNGTPKKSLNGYTSQEMLELFAKDIDVPPNIVFHESYKPHLEKLYKNKIEQSSNELVVFEDNKIVDIKEDNIVWTIDGDERNPQGINGAGAAKAAMSLSKGAKHGVGRGFNGSNAYALVTKSLNAGFLEKSTGILYDKEGYCSVSPEQIRTNIDELYEIARSPEHKDKKFLVSYQYESWPNGTPKKSLNGYTSQEMLEMFVKDKEIPPNIIFHESYKPHIQKLHNSKFSENQSKDSLNNNFNNQKLKKIPNELKNLYPSVFKISDLTFISVEQFLVYSKAKYFGEIEIARITMIINDEPFIKKLINGDITPKDIEANKEYYNEWANIMKTIKSLNEEIKINNDLSWTENLQHLLPLAIKEKILQSTYNQHILKDYINTLSFEDIEDSKINKILIEIFENLHKKNIRSMFHN